MKNEIKTRVKRTIKKHCFFLIEKPKIHKAVNSYFKKKNSSRQQRHSSQIRGRWQYFRSKMKNQETFLND